MRTWLVIPVVAIALALVGCGGKNNSKGTFSSKRKAQAEKNRLGNIDDGARCEMGKGRREVLVDLDHDGNADVRKVYQETPKGEVVICREADLNFDGRIDLYVFFDSAGKTTRDEVDLDLDGGIDIISTYASGKVIKQEIDTNSDGIVDRVRYMEPGAVFWEKDGKCHAKQVPARIEGDTDGDRRMDYWEYYEGGSLLRIGVDKDGDGKADEWSRIKEAAPSACSSNGSYQSEDDSENKDEDEDEDDQEKKDDKAEDGGDKQI